MEGEEINKDMKIDTIEAIQEWFNDNYEPIKHGMLWQDYDVKVMCEIIQEYIQHLNNKQ